MADQVVVVPVAMAACRLAVGALAGGELPLAIVPLGTGNLLAATLGVSRDPRGRGATPRDGRRGDD